MIAALRKAFCSVFFYRNSNCINSISHHQAIFRPINFGGKVPVPLYRHGTFGEIPFHCYRLKLSVKTKCESDSKLLLTLSVFIPFPDKSVMYTILELKTDKFIRTNWSQNIFSVPDLLFYLMTVLDRDVIS